jgi:hypothetical protein
MVGPGVARRIAVATRKGMNSSRLMGWCSSSLIEHHK